MIRSVERFHLFKHQEKASGFGVILTESTCKCFFIGLLCALNLYSFSFEILKPIVKHMLTTCQLMNVTFQYASAAELY